MHKPLIRGFVEFKTKAVTFISSVMLCLRISWESSKLLTIIRIVIESASSLLPFISIFISKEILNVLVSVGATTIAEKRYFLDHFLMLIIFLIVVQFFYKIIQKMKELSAGIHNDYINNHISILVSDKAMSLDLSFFDSTKYYNELTNANRDASSVQMFIWNIVESVSVILRLITSFLLMCQLSSVYAVVIVVAVIPSVITEKRYAEKVYNWQRNTVPEERKIRYILSILTGRGFSKEVKMYNIGEMLLSKYKKIWDNWFKEKKTIVIKKSFIVCAFSILPELCFIGMLYLIGVNIIEGKLTIGDYNLYTGIIGEMIGGLFSLVYVFSRIFDNYLRIGNLSKFLKWENVVKDFGDRIPEKNFKIEFKNVYFKYSGSDRYILNNISFSISSNEKVALVGVNGAGKSTIIKLILRLYEPTEGKILLNGIDLKQYKLQELRKCFSVMFQDYVGYAFSLKENIYLSMISQKDNELKIMEACEKSGVEDIISRFDKGMDTFLTREFEEEGEELSGGEWQKVALARTFFRDSNVIILDEPSASLDPESEHKIFKMFNKLCTGKGAIFISHRLSNVVMADRIVVLDDGKIIEQGTHRDLLKLKGKYAYLFGLQAEKYVEIVK